jgi:hypothetical protein
MTPGEVKGLQSLAMAHGGSLTVNPETGLPEAGFLKSLLPMVAGFFLGPAGIGLTAMQSALTVGALGTAATGSLGKGFMMGMGAYGGAGLGEGLTKVGAQAAKPVESTLAGNTQNVGLNTVDMVPKTTPQTIGGTNTFGNVTAEAGFKPMNLSDTPGFGQVNQKSIMFQDAPQGYITNTSPMQQYTSNMKADLLNPIAPPAPVTPVAPNMSPKLDVLRPVDAGSDLSRGFGRATDSFEGAKEVWDATPKGTGYGLMATGASYLQERQEEAAAEAKAKADAMAAARRGTIRPYEFSTEQDPSAYADTSTAESRYFVEPRFIAKEPYKAKEGGLMSLAVGGPVEEMSAANSTSGNRMYPQALYKTDIYSNPMTQRPMPTDVIRSGLDAPVDPYSGAAKFASGGSTDPEKTQPQQNLKYSYNPDTMQYTKTDLGPRETSGLSGGFGGMIPKLLRMMKQSTAPAHTTTTSGGISAPYIPPGQAPMSSESTPTAMGLGSAMPMVPNIQLPQAQSANQQLGLESFYPMMEQQLAMQGAQNQTRGYAEGGVTGSGGIDLHVPLNFGSGQGSGNGFSSGANGYSAAGSGTQGSQTGAPLPAPLPPQTQPAEETPMAATQNVSRPFVPRMQKTGGGHGATAGIGVRYTVGDDAADAYVQGKIQELGKQQTGMWGAKESDYQNFYNQYYQGYANGGAIGYAGGGMAAGGYGLGSYSDGGRLLRGPGDGVSDSIPASIGNHQPARLADGEFVVPARIVSEIGNGSTEAGARKLYAMMDRVQKARRKTVGKDKVAVNTKADKLLPA